MAEQDTDPGFTDPGLADPGLAVKVGSVAAGSTQDGSSLDRPAGIDVRRRAALAKLGLTVAVAYAAPTILHLDRSAKAQILPSCEPPPGDPLPPGCE